MRESLEEAIHNAGYAVPREIVWDGKLRRFPTDLAKAYSEDGWVVAFDDARGRAAAFGSWRLDEKHTWSDGRGRTLTHEDLAQIEAQKAKAREAGIREKNQAAARATRIYEAANQEVAYSAYLAKKGITCPEGVRSVWQLEAKAFGFGGSEKITGLVVPMRNAKGEIRSLQIIKEEGANEKLFMKGGQAGGCFHVLGDLDQATRIYVAEGIATAQSVRQATGATTVVAFSAGNLAPVARAMRALNATAEIQICADDDPAGIKGAEATGFPVLRPGSGCNDFNDLHREKGIGAVVAIVQPKAVDDVDWRAELIVKHKDDGTQQIPCRVHNLALILRHAPEFKGRIRRNLLADHVAIDGDATDDVGQIRVKALMEKSWIGEKVPTGDLQEALLYAASFDAYHPVMDYLDSLRWDGVPRIDDFVSDHLGAPKDEYHMAVSRSLFISAVLRIKKPGCKVDTMVILESPQGFGKTKLWATLFGEWHSEITENINTKDFFIGLRGVWCADFGELDQFSNAETTRIKQIITIQSDNYRGLWERGARPHPRQCIFVGGTNKDDWQKDSTGGRRFLPVKVADAIDLDAVAAVKNQLWAEAVRMVATDPGQWWNIPDAEEHQASRYAGDSWDEIIGTWIEEQTSCLLDKTQFMTTTAEVLTQALKIEPGRHSRADQIRVGTSLRRLGWTSRQETVSGVSGIRVYRKTSQSRPP